MVDLSHRLGAQTVVEGVETAQHLELAQQAGANSVQESFLGLPKPITDYKGAAQTPALTSDTGSRG